MRVMPDDPAQQRDRTEYTVDIHLDYATALSIIAREMSNRDGVETCIEGHLTGTVPGWNWRDFRFDTEPTDTGVRVVAWRES
jgi:hypothetical protein